MIIDQSQLEMAIWENLGGDRQTMTWLRLVFASDDLIQKETLKLKADWATVLFIIK